LIRRALGKELFSAIRTSIPITTLSTVKKPVFVIEKTKTNFA
jgi:hypothetical protein